MIVFKTLRFKNFLSSGNNFTEIELDKAKHTLIVGHNGAGKSTMLDAISFALFGKAHRNINKPQLVNSINKKNCLVEVEFDIGRSSYKIVRGISPGIFEIWKNGTMINQESHSKDYQKLLENNIIKLNHKSFHQIVVLGSSSFIPFMQLSPGHRRSVIEDLLDIGVFSKMNYLIKERNSQLKDLITNISHEINIVDTKKDSQKKYIKDLMKINTSYRKEKESQISEYRSQISDLQNTNTDMVSKISSIKPDLEKNLNHSHNEKQQVMQTQNQITLEIKQIMKDVKFYEGNNICPTCHQDIDEETKDTAIEAAKEKARHLGSRKKSVDNKFTEVDDTIKTLNEKFTEINRLQSEINTNISTISHLQKAITSLEGELSTLIESGGDMSKAQKEMEDLDNAKDKLLNRKMKLTEEYSYNTAMGEMLKDTGIKTKIIKQYLPVINKLVNQYLQVLDFFVSFELDESFNEEIRSRYRDTFSYESFSEGEKQRIDLALLFTWRQIARMKNSVATNLLVLDETFDSSLDHDGIENLMKILYTLSDDTNVFVISHKGEILEGKFEKKIEFKKEKNFSIMV